MADLGNLFFGMHLKDMTDDDLDKLEQKLNRRGIKVGLKAADANEFLRGLRDQLKNETLTVNVKAIHATTTAADIRQQRMLEIQQRAANADALARQKIEEAQRKAEASMRERQARLHEIETRAINANAIAQQKLTSARHRDARAAEKHYESIRRTNQGFSIQSRLLGQVRNQILNVYSIYEAERFFRSMIEIGGEFQKQRIALRAMLNDVAKADVMFGQIKELAIESPFNFRDLMGFTKQIAAFGIPYEEMYETTKRLADISAGLGIDMGRIILAYGQVRSAAVLRGQELRQFTEAGIPLVDELAKKFSELENRVVSAGEVFEKISNREVSFGMVKDILWQLTNEGGKFYNMQEVLTESVSGKLAKLQDAWEVMLGAITEGHSNIIGGVLDTLTGLTEKWENVWAVIKTLFASLSTFKAGMLIINTIVAKSIILEKGYNAALAIRLLRMGKISTGASSLIVVMSRLNAVIKAFAATGAWGGVALGVATLAGLGAITDHVYSHVNKLRLELESLANKEQISCEQDIEGFKVLVEKLGKATKGTKEYETIKDRIQSKYGEYINDLNKEADAYGYLKTKIDAVTEALKNNAMNNTRQRMMNSIETSLAEGLTDKVKNFKDTLKTFYNVDNSQASEIASVMKTYLQEKIKNGENPWTMTFKELDEEVNNIAKDLGITLKKNTFLYTNTNRVGEAAADMAKQYYEFDKAVEDMETLLNDSFKNATAYSVIIDKIKKERELNKPHQFKDEEHKRKYEMETIVLQINSIKHINGAEKEVKKLEAELDRLAHHGDSWIVTSQRIGQSFKNISDLLPSDNDKNRKSFSSYLVRIRKAYEDDLKALEEMKSVKNKDFTEADKATMERLENRITFARQLFKEYNLNIDAKPKKNNTVNPEAEAERRARELLNSQLKDVKENIERITNQWKVFQSVVEKTGDKGLANAFAFGNLDFGENGIMKQLRNEANKILKGTNFDFESVLKMNDDTIKKNKLQLVQPIVEAYKDAYDDLRKSTTENLIEVIAKNKKYAEQIVEIERKKNEDIAKLENNRKTLEQNGFDVNGAIVQRKENAEKEKFKLSFEQFKESSDWVKIFDDLDRVSTATLENMIKELERFITIAPQGAEEVKAIVEALKNARNEVTNRNPFKAMFNAFRSMRNLNKVENLIKKNGGNPVTFKRDQYGFKKGDTVSEEDIKNKKKVIADDLDGSAEGIIKTFDFVADAANYLGNVFEDLGLGSGLADFAGVLGKGASGASSMHGLLSSFGITGPWGAAAGAALGITQGLFALHDKKRDALIEKSQQKVENLKSAYEHLEDSISRGVSSLSHSLHYYEKLQSQVEKFGSKLSDSYSKPFESLKDGGRSYIQSLKNNLKLDPQKTFAYNVHEYLTKLDGFKEALADAIKVGIGSNDLKSDVVKQKQAQYIALLEQRREMQEQLRLEEDKKKKDKSKINDLHGQINELNIQIGTFIEDLAKELFNIDFEAWGQRISDAILDAFAKGEDAAEAFKNVTNDILKDVASGILKNTIITPMFSKLQKKLFGENGEGGMFSGFQNIEDKIPQMSEAIKKFFESEGKEMIEGAQAFLEAFDKATGGSITSDKDSGSSSGLSHGIAGVTEQTADLLASYINAIRADVSVIRALKERYYNSEIPQISAIAQAQLSELNKIAVNTNRNAQFAEDIYNLLYKNVIPGKGFKIG